METTPNTNGIIDAQAQRRLQGVLQKAQRVGFKAMKRLADKCMEEGRCGFAGSIYEALGHNRKAANAYLKGEELHELKRMINAGKLILIKGRAEKAFEIASRQGDWRAAEDWARIAIQGRSNIRSTEVTKEIEFWMACARAQQPR